MGRGVSSGGGQSSLGYLFGSGEAPKPTANTSEAPKVQADAAKPTADAPAAAKPTAAAPAAAVPSASPPSADAGKQIPAGVPGNNANNYFRADGQNCGNFLTV